MSEAAVTYLLQKTDNWLNRERRLPEKINAGIKKLKRKLMMNSAFIKDRDGQGRQDNQIQAWIQQLRDIACEIEVVLDMFAYKNAAHNAPWHAMKTKKGFGNHSIDDAIRKIETDLDSIREMKDAYPIDTLSHHHHAASSSSGHGRRMIAPLDISEAEIDGDLVSRVLVDDRMYKVVFVVGMGGSGKTTLVKLLYEHFKTDFDCHVWLTASEFEKGPELLSAITDRLCSETGPPLSISSPTDLGDKLKNYLQYKRYLIVLDDLWNRQVWESVTYAFPRDNHSRVIITTRRGDIASLCRENYSVDVYQVQPLPLEKARELFYRRAFSGSSAYPLASDRHQKLIEECEGLPLAIVEIGKLVSSQVKNEFELKKLHDSLQAELTSGQLSSITEVLLLSYNELPYHLKSCFLYMTMFPVSYSVKRRMLIRLWIAEGFIEGADGKTVEDIGEEYLKELIQRNLIQASEWDFDGSPKTCRLHNLMHKIALSKSEAENFCKISGDVTETTRRLSIQDGISELNMPEFHVHTMFISGVNPTIPQGIGSSMRLLKILHLDNASLEALPSGIKRLLLLKYLSLCQTRIKMIPYDIGRLRNLETLNLKQTLVTSLPDTLDKLEKLRHLLVCRYKDSGGHTAFDTVQGFTTSTGMSKLTNLQKLSYVKADRDHKLILELKNLTKLRKLGIIDLRGNSGGILCETIQKLENLHSLSMTSMNRIEILNIQEIDNPPPLLKRLYLCGRLEKIPNWILRLHDLVRIHLKWSKLTQQSNPITILGELPNLLELQLLDAYTGDQLDFDAGAFPKLKKLEFELMEELQIIIIEKRALECLEQLVISQCWKLRQIPVGIDNIVKLKELHLKVQPPEFVDPLRRDGQMRHLVQRIQRICYWYLQNGRQWKCDDL